MRWRNIWKYLKITPTYLISDIVLPETNPDIKKIVDKVNLIKDEQRHPKINYGKTGVY